MTNRQLNKFIKIISGVVFLQLVVLISIILNPGDNFKKEFTPREITSQIQSDIFYFDRTAEFTIVDGEKILNVTKSNFGSIEIYGNVVSFKYTGVNKTFIVSETEYDDSTGIHTFCTNNTTIIFDVDNKTMSFESGCEGMDFYINSSIKSNWYPKSSSNFKFK